MMATGRLTTAVMTLLLAASLAPQRVRASDKPETWMEVRSPHFTVVSNGSEKQARRLADQFEQIRAVFQKALNNIRVDPGQPILILAAKNENTLKALLPKFWETKGHMHPAGIFIPGHEKHYVALRLDTEGENPYKVIYHEYVHLIIELNFHRIPVWLNEGYAEVFGNTTIGEKDLKIGQPSESSVLLLRQNKLLPLEVLLKVDHDSPYYNEANRSSVFYAECWALVHYLMFDAQSRQTRPLGIFLQLVQQGVEDIEAGRRAFGDLRQLEHKLHDYVSQGSFYEFHSKSPATVTEKDFQTRALPAAEAAALQGDFHLHMQRPADARALLEEALRQDPNQALANESMGMLHYRLGERDEAARYFARAVQLDSRSYLAHYYHALLLIESETPGEGLPEAEASLRRATELNPNFAPAYVALSTLYATRKESLERALEASRKAAELEPGESAYQLNVGIVFMRMERGADARAMAERALRTAKSPEARAAAESFLREAGRLEEYLARRKQYEEEARASRERMQTYLQRDAAENPPEKAEKAGAEAAGAGSVTAGRGYGMFGKITELRCTDPQEMQLTLSAGGIIMHLHAANRSKVSYVTTHWKPPANFNPCTHLKGLSAQIYYSLVQGQAHDGEILAIEVRR